MKRRSGSRSKAERTPFVSRAALRERAKSAAAASPKEAAKALSVPLWRLRRTLASKVSQPAPAPVAPPPPPTVTAKPSAPTRKSRREAWTREKREEHAKRMKVSWASRRTKKKMAAMAVAIEPPRVEGEQQIAAPVEVPVQVQVPVEVAEPDEPRLTPRERRVLARKDRQAVRAAEKDALVTAACQAMEPVLRRWPFSTVARLHEETGCEPDVIKLGLARLGIPVKRHERPGW